VDKSEKPISTCLPALMMKMTRLRMSNVNFPKKLFVIPSDPTETESKVKKEKGADKIHHTHQHFHPDGRSPSLVFYFLSFGRMPQINVNNY